jgi:transmembrane sensor
VTDEYTPPDAELAPGALDRYLAGETSGDVRANVDRLLTDHPALAAQVRALGEILPGEHRPGHLAKADEAVDRLRRARANGAQAPRRAAAVAIPRVPSSTRPVRTASTRMAMAALGLTAVILGVVSIRQYEMTDAPAARYTTIAGERRQMTLPDGSVMVLAPRTTVRIADGFGRTHRRVSLRGEAYFDVTASTETPFIVQAGTTSTRVLGTAFTVRDDGHSAARVAVLRGKVNVTVPAQHDSTVTLTNGMVAHITDSATTVARDSVVHLVSWTSGDLVFKKVPAREVLAELTRWYGLQFRVIDPELANQKLTVWLSTTSLRNALSTLKLALDVDLQMTDSIITLRPRRDTDHDSRTPPARGRRLDVSSPSSIEVGR